MAAFLESWSLQLRNDTKMSPQLKSFFFFHRHIYSLWTEHHPLRLQAKWMLRSYRKIVDLGFDYVAVIIYVYYAGGAFKKTADSRNLKRFLYV